MSVASTLGPLLGNDRLRVVYRKVTELEDPVGAGAFELEIPDFKKEGTLRFFDETVDVSGHVNMAASASIHGEGERLAGLFGGDDEAEAPPGKSLADLRFRIDGSVGAAGATPPSPLVLSAWGSLASGVDYRHVLPVRQGTKRLTAFANLVKTSLPPQLVRFSELRNGEVHRLDGTLYLDFGLDVFLGRGFAHSLSLALFDGLPSADVTANGQLAIQAALGLSLYERMYLACGRAGRRVRVRIQREHERRLGFSGTMWLQARYDFGGSLAMVLEQALGQVGTPRLLETLRRIVDPLARGDWETIKARLGDELSDTLSQFLDSTDWTDWLADSREVQDLFDLAAKVVDLYDGIEPTIQSFWDRLLGKADLGPDSRARRLLGQLTRVGQPGFEIEDFLRLDGDARELTDLLEALSGKSLEEILLSSSSEVGAILDDVADLARQAEGIFDLGNEAVARLHQYAETTGVAATIDLLRRNATSIDSLRDFVSRRLRRLVERLVGKAWDEIESSDLDRVQAWAERIRRVLDAPLEVEDRLLSKIREIEGEVGFSLSFEIERVSTSTALVDFEVERGPEHQDLHRRLETALARGNVRDLLEVLAGEADKEEHAARALPFRLRESAFSSRRVRSSAATLVVSLLGPFGKLIENQQGINRRIEESWVRITEKGRRVRREGTYTGGFSRTDVWNKTTNASAVWLEVWDSGGGLDLEAAYDDAFARSLRITYSREDLETAQQELEVIAARLEDLGFGDADLGQVPPDAQTRFTLDVRLPEEALVDFCRDLKQEALWNRDFLVAAHRWFQEKLVGKRAADSPASAHGHGEVLDAFITQAALFRARWTASVQEFAREARGKVFTVILPGNRRVSIHPPLVASGPLPSPPFRAPYSPVRELIGKRSRGLGAMRKLAASLRRARDERTPARYEELTTTFSDAFKAASVHSSQWPTPTFGSWLILTRLSRLSPGVLRLATGLAMLRWKDAASEETGDDSSAASWQGPVVWRLEDGLTPWPDRETG